jgi:hypothetical protein
MVPSETSQGQEHKDQRQVVDENVRSARVYNEWETSAMFDVLWASDDTRKSYVDSFCKRRGKSEIDKSAMLREHLEENQKNISFYVLADVRDRFHPDLSGDNPAWTMFLDFNGQKVAPSSIKEVELDPEVLVLFSHRFPKPKFKISYLVKFPAKSAAGNFYVQPGIPFKMMLSSTTKQCELGWQGGHPVRVKNVRRRCDKKRKLMKDEDFYWI